MSEPDGMQGPVEPLVRLLAHCIECCSRPMPRSHEITENVLQTGCSDAHKKTENRF